MEKGVKYFNQRWKTKQIACWKRWLNLKYEELTFTCNELFLLVESKYCCNLHSIWFKCFYLKRPFWEPHKSLKSFSQLFRQKKGKKSLFGKFTIFNHTFIDSVLIVVQINQHYERSQMKNFNIKVFIKKLKAYLHLEFKM